MWGWYHYPRRALHAVETLDARGSRWLICRFYAATVLALCGQNIPTAGTTPPQLLTAHTAAHRGKHGAFSPPETSAGSIGSTARVPCASSLSARRSSMSRFPLLRRTTAEMPVLLSAATLCRIRRDTFRVDLRGQLRGSADKFRAVTHQFREKNDDPAAQQLRLRPAVRHQLPHIFRVALQRQLPVLDVAPDAEELCGALTRSSF